MRKDFGSNPWFYPLPVLIIGTYDEWQAGCHECSLGRPV